MTPTVASNYMLQRSVSDTILGRKTCPRNSSVGVSGSYLSNKGISKVCFGMAFASMYRRGHSADWYKAPTFAPHIGQVVPLGAKKQVPGVGTLGMVARVKHIQTIGNRPELKIVGEAMGKDTNPGPPSNVEVAITLGLGTTPSPAVIGCSASSDLCPVAPFQRDSLMVVALHEAQETPFNLASCALRSGGYLRFLPTTTLAEPLGNVRMVLHGVTPIQLFYATPRAVSAAPGLCVA